MLIKRNITSCDGTDNKYPEPVAGAAYIAKGATGRWCEVMHCGPEWLEEHPDNAATMITPNEAIAKIETYATAESPQWADFAGDDPVAVDKSAPTLWFTDDTGTDIPVHGLLRILLGQESVSVHVEENVNNPAIWISFDDGLEVSIVRSAGTVYRSSAVVVRGWNDPGIRAAELFTLCHSEGKKS